MEDALSQLYAAMSKLSNEEMTSGQTSVQNDQAERKGAEARRNAELARAQREANKGGFFKSLEKSIGVVGVVGLCTFNYALVAGDIAAHKTGLVKNMKLDVADGVAALAWQTRPELLLADILVRKLNVAPDELKKEINDKLGPVLDAGVSDDDVKPIVDKAVEANLLVAGTATSILTAGSTSALVVAIVAAAMSAGAFTNQELDGPGWLTVGLDVCNAALTIGMGAGVDGAKSAIDGTNATEQAANKAALALDGASGIANGTDTITNAIHQHKADDATNKAQAALFALQKLERMIDDLIDAMKDTQASRKQTSSAIQGALQTHDQTNLSAATAIRA